MKSEQETFDHVVAHIRAQGYVRSWAFSMCAYRGANGRMCAVGCLIDDAHYSPQLEQRGATDPRVVAAVRGSGWNARGSMLIGLQDAHDGMRSTPAKNKSFFERKAAAVAFDLGLDYPPPA